MDEWRTANLTMQTSSGRAIFRACVCGRRIGWDGHAYLWCDLPGARETAAINMMTSDEAPGEGDE